MTYVYDNELLLDPHTYTPLDIQTVLVRGNGGRRVPPPGAYRRPSAAAWRPGA